MTRGYTLEQIVEAGLAPSVRWLADQIRAKKIPARKIGGRWRMTEEDIEAALELWASKPSNVPARQLVAESGLSLLSMTPTSRRRRTA